MELIINALWITLLGMGLTFGAIVLFWGMMSLITAIPVREEKEEIRITEPDSLALPETGQKAKAAAVAIALALAEQEQQQVAYFPMPVTAFLSAWQLGMRTRQMTQKGNSKR
ncbi:MAG: OadG family protein [Anaerolineales bacterium]|jgi:Na+-transporting methylmalonyl-CoA/oxaloacetate decarboxylase gamma subunit|nr:OadG family protein [Anaerolineales bacterium]